MVPSTVIGSLFRSPGEGIQSQNGGQGVLIPGVGGGCDRIVQTNPRFGASRILLPILARPSSELAPATLVDFLLPFPLLFLPIPGLHQLSPPVSSLGLSCEVESSPYFLLMEIGSTLLTLLP